MCLLCVPLGPAVPIRMPGLRTARCPVPLGVSHVSCHSWFTWKILGVLSIGLALVHKILLCMFPQVKKKKKKSNELKPFTAIPVQEADMCRFSPWVKSSDKASLRDVGYDDRMRKIPNSNHSWAESPAQEHKSLFPIRPCLYKRW